MDKLTKEQRRKNMQAVKATGSEIEVALARELFKHGYRYRKNNKKIFGKPDFTFAKLKIAVFVDSEFWHGKNWEIRKHDHKSNQAFWHAKIERNIQRDIQVNKELKRLGWKTLRFWGNDIKSNLPRCIAKIEKEMVKARKMKFQKKISPKNIDIKNFMIEAAKSQNNTEAVLTHYVHNSKNNASRFLRSEAVSVAKQILGHYYPETKITNVVAEEALQYGIFDPPAVPFPPPKDPKFTFIDLFAGIGGFRLALQNLGGKCIFTSEWDQAAQNTYKANFGEMPFGDITKDEIKKYIPPGFDILCAGFPCQAFSIAGKRGGFEDTRGTLFFDVAEIIKRFQPKGIFLENVKGLRNHDRGRTLTVILDVLRNNLNYFVPEPKIINAKDFGVPQNRERLFIVGFHKSTGVQDFEYPHPIKKKVVFSDVKEEKKVETRYYLSTQYLSTLQTHKSRHESKGNGFGFEIIRDDGIANAIVVGGMGKERNLVYDHRITDFTPQTKIKGEVNREGIRKMTPREWARLQGFPDEFVIPVSDASAYKQFGNSVAVPAIQATAKKIMERIIT